MSMQTIGEDSWPVSALTKGWQRLMDGAHNALTHFRPDGEDETSGGNAAAPRWGVLAVDVVEHSGYLELSMELPGMSRKDLRVEADARTLLVTGHRRTESSRMEGTALISERAFGQFRRAFSLPAGLDVGALTASYRKGVLLVKLPKERPGSALRREIAIS